MYKDDFQVYYPKGDIILFNFNVNRPSKSLDKLHSLTNSPNLISYSLLQNRNNLSHNLGINIGQQFHEANELFLYSFNTTEYKL